MRRMVDIIYRLVCIWGTTVALALFSTTGRRCAGCSTSPGPAALLSFCTWSGTGVCAGLGVDDNASTIH
ncbi:MAG: hypothetical protein V1245_06935 [Arenicellales bacterium]|nr:hypothetical protein [Arenicellales bacterium]MDP6313442.1 hypothetical protein [Arenicellales bacterium]MEE1559126.1 hypothetical protein [Arenicellales bacterium]